MPGTFFGLEIARRGLQTHRTAMDTTGHNVANANTPGYTRQEAVITATDPYCNPTLSSRLIPGQLGTGVAATMIRRIKNEYLDVQARDSTSAREYWQIQEELFARIEAVFAEPGATGIGDTLTKFFRYWHDLNNTPQDPGVKAAVAEAGDELATMMREAYKQLGDISESILKTAKSDDDSIQVTGGQLQDQVATVNEILRQVRDLTESIKRIYAQGNQPNDLLDRRDLLLDRLAEYGPVSVTHLTDGGKPTGEISLTFFGQDVRSENAKVELTVTSDSNDPKKVREIKLAFSDSGNEVSLTGYPQDQPRSGSLLGLAETYQKIEGNIAASNEILGYRDMLNELSIALGTVINSVLTPNFFAVDTSQPLKPLITLADGGFGVNQDIMQNPSQIDGTKALYIARLASIGMDGKQAILGQDAAGNNVTITTYNLNGATFNEYFNGILADIGARSGSAADLAANQDAVAEQIESLRQSVSGVNLDEELSRLLQFQYGYQASARVMATIDEMLDYLINRTG